MNISALQGIRDEIGIQLNESETTNSDVYTNWVNQGLRDLQFSFPINPYFLTSADRTLSSGTRSYLAQSDFEHMDSITIPAQDVTLRYVPPEQFDILQPSATEGGVPVIYTIRGQGLSARIEYYPQPGASYTVHQNYFRLPSTVSAGSASPDIPVKFSELLVLYGVKQGLRRRGKYVEAREVGEEYELLKEKMKMELMNLSNEIPSIKSVRGFQQSSNNINQDWIKTIYGSP